MFLAGGTAQITSLVAYSLLASAGLWLGCYAFYLRRQSTAMSSQRLFLFLSCAGVLIAMYGIYGIVGLVTRTSMLVDGFLDLMLLLFMLVVVVSIRYLHQDSVLAFEVGDWNPRLHRWVERGFGGIIIIEGTYAYLLGSASVVQVLVASTGGLIAMYGLLYDSHAGTVSSIHGTTLDAFRRLLLAVLGFAGVIAVSHTALFFDVVPMVLTPVETTVHVLIAAFLLVLALRIRQVI